MTLGELSLADYLERLASRNAAPGGGAVAALSGAEVAALASMVEAVGAKGAPTPAQETSLQALQAARLRLMALATEDGVAFSEVTAAYQLPKGTAPEKAARSAAIERALHGATSVPLAVMRELGDLWPLLAAVAAQASANVASDGAIAVDLWGSALRAARYNVLINLRYIKDEDFRSTSASACEALVAGHAARSEALLRKLETLFGPVAGGP